MHELQAVPSTTKEHSSANPSAYEMDEQTLSKSSYSPETKSEQTVSVTNSRDSLNTISIWSKEHESGSIGQLGSTDAHETIGSLSHKHVYPCRRKSTKRQKLKKSVDCSSRRA